MSEKPEALRLADALECFSGNYRFVSHKAAAELRNLHAENERLREENRLWYSRAVALFWKCDTDNITVGRLQSAAKEIDAALRREET